jgi:hypothetical protein
LSVEISNRGSSRWTLSPVFFSHLVIVPSKIDSPIWGITTSVGIVPFHEAPAQLAGEEQTNIIAKPGVTSGAERTGLRGPLRCAKASFWRSGGCDFLWSKELFPRNPRLEFDEACRVL